MGGVTPQGFERDSVQTIRARIEARQLTNISQGLDVSDESPLGQINGIFAEMLGEAWEALEAAYNAFDADKAEDVTLTNLAKVTGTVRRGARPSRVVASCNLDAGTELIPSLNFAHVRDKPAARFTPERAFVAPNDGVHFVPFVSEQAGPVPAPQEHLTVIVAPGTQGWNSITNDRDAELGHPADTNATLRLRRIAELMAMGNGTVGGIASKVSQVPGVQTADCFENVAWYTNSDGLPPHSIEVLIFDGLVPLPIDDAVAQAIWDSRGGGINYHGSSSGIARRDDGTEVEVSFSRVTPKRVYLEIELHIDPEKYGGDDALRAWLATEANAAQSRGVPVRARQIDSLVLPRSATQPGFPGVLDVLDFRLGFEPHPTGRTNLPIGIREIANFDSGDIVVTTVSS